MKKGFAKLKQILFRVVLVYFLFCIFYKFVMWTSNIGCSDEFNSSNCPDAWVIREPDPPDWVKNNPANDWLAEKWEAPEWTKDR